MGNAISADQFAQNLLRVELGDAYGGSNYDKLIKKGWSGYAVYYLGKTVNWHKCSTRAKLKEILQLAEIDLKKRTRLERIVFDCCWFAPTKKNIKAVVALENGETIETKMKKILEYQDNDGDTCLIMCYNMLVGYEKRGNDPSKASMKRSIEKTIEFLSKWARAAVSI